MPTRSFVRDPGLWLRAMSERRAAISFAPHSAFARSAHRTSPEEVAALDLGHVYVLGCGAEPINNSVLQRFLNTFAPAGLNPEALTPCYGLAEATLAVTLSPVGRRYRPDYVRADALPAGHAAPIENVTAPEASEGVETLVGSGPPLRDHQIIIRDTTGADLGERAVGEIWVRGPSVAHAYLGADPEAHNSFGPDGWPTISTPPWPQSVDHRARSSPLKAHSQRVYSRKDDRQGCQCAMERTRPPGRRASRRIQAHVRQRVQQLVYCILGDQIGQ